MLPKSTTYPYAENQLKRFASKADEKKFWDDLENERVAHDPALEFSRFHRERIGLDQRTHQALISAIHALTATLASPSANTSGTSAKDTQNGNGNRK